MEHVVDRVIETIAPEYSDNDGYFGIRHVMCSPDNRSCVLIVESIDQRHGKLIFTKGGVELDSRFTPRFSLSFDGTKLAYAVRNPEGGSDIFVNGELKHHSDFDTVYHLEWLPSETGELRLAWYGWHEDEDGRPVRGDNEDRYFVDGNNWTGRIMFEPVIGERGKLEILVMEDGWCYTVKSDGSIANLRRACCDNPFSCTCDFNERLEVQKKRQESNPQEENDETRGIRVTYGGVVGEWFDGLESGGGMRTYAFNGSQDRAGYIGFRYPGIVKKIAHAADAALDRAEGQEKIPWWGWPIAFLFNPYFGICAIAGESSKRYYPVNHDRGWRKGYTWAGDHFFTPDNRFVVTVQDGKGYCVVIDEEEGPKFDEIYNVVYLSDARCVCYAARRGNEIVRVVVK